MQVRTGDAAGGADPTDARAAVNELADHDAWPWSISTVLPLKK